MRTINGAYAVDGFYFGFILFGDVYQDLRGLDTYGG